MIVPKKSSKWEITIHEDEDDVLEVHLKGPSAKVNDLMMLEVLLRGLRSWDSDVNFQDGKAPKEITKKWFLPLSKVKAKLNPSTKTKGTKSKKIQRQEEQDFEHAIRLYKEFNGTDPKEMISEEVWLPDNTGGPHSPLVAIGEGTCPFVGYSSGKTNSKGELDSYIHHFGEDDDGNITMERPRIYVTVPPPGYRPILLIIGGVFDIEDREDPNTGKTLKWLVN